MDNATYFKAIKETVKQLENIMKVSIKDRAKDSVKKAMGRSVRTNDPLFWPAGMLMLGLVSASEYLDTFDDAKVFGDNNAEPHIDAQFAPGTAKDAISPGFQADINRAAQLNEEIEKVLSKHADLWFYRYKGQIEYVDDALAGYCFLKMYKRTGNQKFLVPAKAICDYILKTPRDEAGSVIYNASRGGKIIFADGVGQVTMFTSEYGKYNIPRNNKSEESMTGDVVNSLANAFGGVLDKVVGKPEELPSLKELETALLTNYYKFGRDEKSGLIYHGYELKEKVSYVVDGDDNEQQRRHIECYPEKKGLMCWGRAFGWLLMGLSAASDNRAWFEELCDKALEYQRDDGGWSWQLQAIDGHIDMSATGMIAYSIASGLRNNAFSEDKADAMKAAVRKAEACMLSHISEGLVTDALSSCDDFGVHYQTYGQYPWGQGAVLAALSLWRIAE